MIGVGILGCGRHGQRYLNHILRGDIPGLEVRSWWRRDAQERERIVEKYGLAAAASRAAMLDDPSIQLVIVTTPPGPHAQDIREILDAGKKVLVEKPLCATFQEALELGETLGVRTRDIMVAQTLRFDPTLRALKEALPSIGSIHRIRISQRLEPSSLAWQRDRSLAGGGSITLTGIHGFDLLRWLLGDSPDDARADLLAVDHPFENLFEAVFLWSERPCLASVEVSKFSASRSATIEVVGREGQLHADYQRGRLEIIIGPARRILTEPGPQPTLPPTLEAARAWVAGERENPVSFDEGLQALAMVDAAYRSHASGRREALAPTGPRKDG